jgi:hypothetical protein
LHKCIDEFCADESCGSGNKNSPGNSHRGEVANSDQCEKVGEKVGKKG